MFSNKKIVFNKKSWIVLGLLSLLLLTIVFNALSISQTAISNRSRASETFPTPTPTLCLQKEKGDANCDGFITETDRNLWREEYKQGKTFELQADFNKDSLVNYDDYRIWFTNWKQ